MSTRRADPSADAHALTSLRADKWLWAARFYKTRALAVEAIDKGHVRLNDKLADTRIKPAHALRIGNVITVRKEGLSWTLKVRGLSERRLSAPLAAALYEETAESLAARQQLLEQLRAEPAPHFPGRPTKRDRRALEAFLNEP